MSIYCETIKADESGLTLAAQLLDGDGVALGDPITTGFTELATDSDNITHYWFAADIDLTTVKGIRFYDTGDATNFHTRTLKIAAAQTAATAAQSAAEAVETLVEAEGAGDLAAIKTQTDKLSFTGTDVKATLDGEEVTPTTASKTGYSLTAAYDAAKTAGTSTLDAAGVRAELSTELGRIDAAISSRHAAGAAVAKSPATLDWSADVSNKPTIPALADIRNASEYTGAFTADVLANAPAGGEGGGLTEEQAAQLAAILEYTGTSGVQVADKAGYSLSGSALSLGPTASRSKTDGYYKCPQGGTIGLYRRILGWDGDDLQQGDVSTITYSIFVLSSDDPQARTAVDGHEDVTLDKAEVLFDEVRSDQWASNYNFKHIPDISTKTAFAKAGADYLVEYTITPTSGQKIIERIRVKAT